MEMKIRNGFVSNSSSSSFIVYNDKEKDVDYSHYRKYFKEEESPFVDNNYFMVLPLRRNSRLKSFGWSFSKRASFEDKVNFLLLQLKSLENFLYPSNREFNKMYDTIKNSFYGALQLLLEKTLDTKDCYLDVKMDYNAMEVDSKYKNYIYIDHQSLWTDDYNLKSINEDTSYFLNIRFPWLLDKKSVLNFLVGDSYIQTGNDNEEGTEEYYESRKLEQAYIQKNEEVFKKTYP